jgi:hypothetical protein
MYHCLGSKLLNVQSLFSEENKVKIKKLHHEVFNIVFNENCFVCIKFLSAFLRKMKRKRKPHPNVLPKILKFFVLQIEKVFRALSDYAEMKNNANSNRASVQSIFTNLTTKLYTHHQPTEYYFAKMIYFSQNNLLFYKRANSVRKFGNGPF